MLNGRMTVRVSQLYVKTGKTYALEIKEKLPVGIDM